MAGGPSAKDKFDNYKMDESRNNIVTKSVTTIKVLMAPNLTTSTYKIVSLVEGSPAGVNFSLLPEQTVYLNAPVAHWVVRPEGDNTYRLSVGAYPYTKIVNDKLTASIDQRGNKEWIATYREDHDAYTISEVGATTPEKAWLVFDSQTDPHAPVRVLELVVSQPGPPKVYVDSQLWRIVPA